MKKIGNRHDSLAKMEMSKKHNVKADAHKSGHLKIKHHNKRSQGKRHASKKTIL